MVAKFQPPGRQAIFHTENGILGFGEAPPAGEEDWDLIDAGKKAVTLKPGTAFFCHADSFAMVRGGHLDVAILGAYEVAENGDLANWSTGPKGVPAVGGAMELVHGAKRVAVITDHVTMDGKAKCDLHWSDLIAYGEGLIAVLIPDMADETCGFHLRWLHEAFGDRAYMALTLPRRRRSPSSTTRHRPP